MIAGARSKILFVLVQPIAFLFCGQNNGVSLIGEWTTQHVCSCSILFLFELIQLYMHVYVCCIQNILFFWLYGVYIVAVMLVLRPTNWFLCNGPQISCSSAPNSPHRCRMRGASSPPWSPAGGDARPPRAGGPSDPSISICKWNLKLPALVVKFATRPSREGQLRPSRIRRGLFIAHSFQQNLKQPRK